MSELVLKNVKIYLKGYDLSGDMNSVTLTQSADMLDRTVFGANSRQRKAGLKDIEFSGAGFWNSSGSTYGSSTGLLVNKPDPVIYNAVGGTSDLMTLLPEGTALGGLAYFSKNLVSEYVPGGSIGEMLGFTFAAFGAGSESSEGSVRTGSLIRGKVMEAGLKTSAIGIARAFGSATTQMRLYAGVHVKSIIATTDVPGDASIKLKVQRSTAANFGVVHSTVFTFTLTTADVGEGLWATTKFPTTNATVTTGRYSYRVRTSQLGSSNHKFNLVCVFGQQ